MDVVSSGIADNDSHVGYEGGRGVLDDPMWSKFSSSDGGTDFGEAVREWAQYRSKKQVLFALKATDPDRGVENEYVLTRSPYHFDDKEKAPDHGDGALHQRNLLRQLDDPDHPYVSPDFRCSSGSYSIGYWNYAFGAVPENNIPYSRLSAIDPDAEKKISAAIRKDAIKLSASYLFAAWGKANDFSRVEPFGYRGQFDLKRSQLRKGEFSTGDYVSSFDLKDSNSRIYLHHVHGKDEKGGKLSYFVLQEETKDESNRDVSLYTKVSDFKTLKKMLGDVLGPVSKLDKGMSYEVKTFMSNVDELGKKLAADQNILGLDLSKFKQDAKSLSGGFEDALSMIDGIKREADAELKAEEAKKPSAEESQAETPDGLANAEKSEQEPQQETPSEDLGNSNGEDPDAQDHADEDEAAQDQQEDGPSQEDLDADAVSSDEDEEEQGFHDPAGGEDADEMEGPADGQAAGPEAAEAEAAQEQDPKISKPGDGGKDFDAEGQAMPGARAGGDAGAWSFKQDVSGADLRDYFFAQAFEDSDEYQAIRNAGGRKFDQHLPHEKRGLLKVAASALRNLPHAVASSAVTFFRTISDAENHISVPKDEVAQAAGMDAKTVSMIQEIVEKSVEESMSELAKKFGKDANSQVKGQSQNNDHSDGLSM